MIETLDIRTWQDFDREHPAPTFFARPAWALALAQTMPGLEAAPLRVLLRGRRFLVPTMRSTRVKLRFREHLAFPLGAYSCVLDEHGRAVGGAIASDVLSHAASGIHHLRFTPWPLAPIDRAAPALARTHATAVIDCAGGLDVAMAGVRGVTRRMAGQAARRGVHIVRAGANAAKPYYALLERASAGWQTGRPSISLALLTAVLHHGGDDAQIWLAHVGEHLIGGGIVLFGSDELFFWSAAMLREYSRFRPSNALNVVLIAQACSRGVRWYNLGASEGLPGVERFKHDLGATSVSYVEYSFQHPAFQLYEHVRSRLRGRSRSA
jgi:CelD/BcsL family acetyltransferase involved in cellulose biosynthesis